jgi:hypothetical protein
MDDQQTNTQPVNAVPTPVQSIKSGLLDGFVKDRDGKSSSSRLLILLWGLGVFAIWAFSSLQATTLQAIPDSVITILGVLVGGKTIQRFGE